MHKKEIFQPRAQQHRQKRWTAADHQSRRYLRQREE